MGFNDLGGGYKYFWYGSSFINLYGVGLLLILGTYLAELKIQNRKIKYDTLDLLDYMGSMLIGLYLTSLLIVFTVPSALDFVTPEIAFYSFLGILLMAAIFILFCPGDMVGLLDVGHGIFYGNNILANMTFRGIMVAMFYSNPFLIVPMYLIYGLSGNFGMSVIVSFYIFAFYIFALIVSYKYRVLKNQEAQIQLTENLD